MSCKQHRACMPSDFLLQIALYIGLRGNVSQISKEHAYDTSAVARCFNEYLSRLMISTLVLRLNVLQFQM